MNIKFLNILAAVALLVLGGCVLAGYDAGGYYRGSGITYVGIYPYGSHFAYYPTYPGYYGYFPYFTFYGNYPVFIDRRPHSWHGHKDGIVKHPHVWHGRQDWNGRKGDGWHDRKDGITGKPGGGWPDRQFNRDGRPDRGGRGTHTPALKCASGRC